MRVLVTGCSGHVGGAIAGMLHRDGHEVIGLSRRLTRSCRALSGAVAADIGRPGLAAELLREQGSCDAVVHAAAALELDPFAAEVTLANCLGTQQLLEVAHRWRARSFVFISSVPVIGRPARLPVTEDHAVCPQTAYHASKLFGEHLVSVACSGDLRGAVLRITSPAGPGAGDGRILGVFVRRALEGSPLEVAGSGTRAQDYVDVRDVAAAVSSCLDQRVRGRFNVASGRCVSNLELARMCVRQLGSASPVKLTGAADPEEGARWEVSIEKARQAFGYEPRWTLEDSIAAVAQDARRPGDG